MQILDCERQILECENRFSRAKALPTASRSIFFFAGPLCGIIFSPEITAGIFFCKVSLPPPPHKNQMVAPLYKVIMVVIIQSCQTIRVNMVSFKKYSKCKSTVGCTVTLTAKYHSGNS